MFNGGFAEASSGKAHLPEDDPDMFDVLCRWIYTDEFRMWDEEREDDVDFKTSQTILMYLFLDKLCIRELGDEMISVLMYSWIKSEHFPGLEHLTAALSQLPEHCNFRKCFLYSYHFLLNGLVLSERTIEQWPTAAMGKILSDDPALTLEYVEFLRTQPRGAIAQDPREMPFCTFHAHGEGVECPFRSGERARDTTAMKDTAKTTLLHQR
ncbi:uncharacterized protein L3040_004081 [Drepanopeziza brunnea f. sp. 'multigermtubi']|nr:hypothetical protein L3040_004081 [Drepanopeziza brunnea f. sp. 'multigermtubi']